MSSSWGAWPNRKIEDTCLSRANSRNRREGSAPATTNPFGGFSVWHNRVRSRNLRGLHRPDVGLESKSSAVAPAPPRPWPPAGFFRRLPRSGSAPGPGDNFGSSRSIAIPWRTIYNCMISSQFGVRIRAARNHEQKPQTLFSNCQLSIVTVNLPATAGNKSAREILFQTVRRCGWHRAGLPLRRPARSPASHGAALKRSAKFQNVLPVRMIERLRNPQDSCEPSCNPLVRIT